MGYFERKFVTQYFLKNPPIWSHCSYASPHTHTIFLTCSNPPYLPLSLSPNSAFSHSHVSKHKNCAFINLATTTTPPPTTTTTPPTTFCNCPKELQSHIFFEPVFKVWKRLREEAGHRGRVGRL